MDTFGYVHPQVRKVRRISYYENKPHSVGFDITAELLPFKKVMIKQLNRRGYNTLGTPFKYIIPLYYNEIVSSKNLQNSPYVPINSFEFVNNPAFKIKDNDFVNGDLRDHYAINHFVQVGGVVDNIISVFRTAKIKKRSAILNGQNPKEVLTDDELLQAQAADKIEKDLENKFMNSLPVKSGTLKTLIIWTCVIWLIVYLCGK